MADETIKGRLFDQETGAPLAKLRIEAFVAADGQELALGRATAGDDGSFTLKPRRGRGAPAEAKDVFFRVFRDDELVADTRHSARWDPRRSDVPVLVPVPGGPKLPATPVVERFEVEGVVTGPDGVAVPGLRVEAWDHTLDGPRLVGVGATDEGGRYAIVYDPSALNGKSKADLEVRVVDPGRDNAPVGTSPVLYQAAARAAANVVVDAAVLATRPEFDRVVEAVTPLLEGKALADVSPEGVTFLAHRTGWDARVVAMAVNASRASQSSGIPAEHTYALLRAGVAPDGADVARVADAVVVKSIEAAVANGIIRDGLSVEETLERHRASAVERLESFVPKGAASSLGQLLDLRLEGSERTTFLELYRAHADEPERLWAAAAARGIDSGKIDALRLDGKLGELTFHNAPVMARLAEQAGVRDVTDVVEAGLYKAEAWAALVGDDVPEGLSKEAYAEGLAAQVVASFPTLVTAHMVANDEIEVGAPDARGEVARFLGEAKEQRRLGIDPVQTWAGFEQLSTAGRDTALELERLYRLTPSHDALAGLSRTGLSSARDVARMPVDWFVEQHGGQFRSLDEARMVHARSKDVHGGALNLATMCLSYLATPTVYAVLGPATGRTRDLVPEGPAKATLETLFKNLDYCACDHCQSVLSPAAYLVELLEMLDVSTVPAGKSNPQTVLFRRRPDIQHILLTCENTNVALAYLDVVNEILEHYIVNGNLTTYAGHNVDRGVASADLLADPQYALAGAYTTVQGEVHPHPLPFDYALEALRLLFQVWGISLADALRVFTGAAAARREVLGLNSAEARILTDATFRSLPVYFGEPAATTIAQLNDRVANGKAFCRRMGISYEDLVAVLGARFVNPGIEDVPLLHRLRLPIATVHSFFTGATTEAALVAALPADLDAAPYGGSVAAWLTARRNRILGLITLTDLDPGATECDFAKVELRFALPDPANNRLDAFAYHRLHRFIRMWRTLGWDIGLTDRVLTTFLGVAPDALTEATLDATLTAALARVANFKRLLTTLDVPAKKVGEWLAVWDAAADVPTRRARLAQLLRMGTVDLDNLVAITGIDPLAVDMEADEPSMLAFVARWSELKAVPLKVADLDYLLRHVDASGKLAPTPAALATQLKLVRDAMTAVDAALGEATQRRDVELAKAQMALVYDDRVVDRFFGLVAGSHVYAATFTTVEESLPQKLRDVDPRLDFDPFAKELRFSGVMAPAVATALGTAAEGLVMADMSVVSDAAGLAAYVTAFKAAVDALRLAGANDLAALGAEYPELATVFTSTVGIADAAERASQLVSLLLPELRGRLKERALRAALTAITGADPQVIEVVTAGATTLHAHSDPAKPVLDDLLGLEARVAVAADGTFDLHVDPPATDDYILYVGAPETTSITLVVGGTTAIPTTAVGASGEVQSSAAVRLRAGALAPLTLTVAGLPAGRAVTLRWRTKAMAKADVPAARLTGEPAAAEARASLVRLQKAVLLQSLLGLTARELHHLATVNVDTRGVLDDLAAAASPAVAVVRQGWQKLAWMVWFTTVRRPREPEADMLVQVLEDPAMTTAAGAPVLPLVMGWAPADVTGALAALGLAVADLASLANLRRVAAAADLATAAGQAAADLDAWAVADPGVPLVETVKAKLRAQLSDTAWRETMRSVSDELRNRRRDALVAYILAFRPPTPKVTTPDELYEHFLVDVQMDACMQTSRIRAALSSVQLFVTRCLMNLEDDVSPASIPAHWAWMKRYRVWEANRKVFLYPENWLEPELRDNKSPFFRELEAELLKGDITEEAAEDAFYSYLKKLDDVAHLEIAAGYLEQKEPGNPDDDVLHVFGRSMGTTRTYYYRRFEYGYWTPWEKVPLNIQGDVLFPVKWKDRLFLFWADTSVKPQGAASKVLRSVADENWAGHARVSAEITLQWGELYKGKWVSPKSTDMSAPVRFTGLQRFTPGSLVVAGRTERPSPDVSERLVLMLFYLGGASEFRRAKVTFTSKNARPWVEDVNDNALVDEVGLFNYTLLWSGHPDATLDANSLLLRGRTFDVNVTQPASAASPTKVETVLTKTAQLLPGFRVRPLLHPAANQWETPVFYSDERSAFFVVGDEHVHSWVDTDIYFPPTVVGPKLDDIRIPELYEKPLLPDLLGPVVRDGGFTDPVPELGRLITTEAPFVFDGVAFDAKGVVTGGFR